MAVLRADTGRSRQSGRAAGSDRIRPPYFWSLMTRRTGRLDGIKDGWKSVGKVIIVALVLDIAYQIIVLRFVYPAEAFIVVIAPYLILRGPVTRLAAKK
jgi:hypothetical protein